MLSVLRAVKPHKHSPQRIQCRASTYKHRLHRAEHLLHAALNQHSLFSDINKVLLTAEPSQPESTTEYQCLLSTTLIQIYPIKPLQRQNGFPFNRAGQN